jgi:hypothetical protein
VDRNRTWDDLTPAQRTAIVALGALEAILTVVAVRDLVRRPRALVRGPKPLWLVGCAVQPVGPMAYLVAGRRRA